MIAIAAIAVGLATWWWFRDLALVVLVLSAGITCVRWSSAEPVDQRPLGSPRLQFRIRNIMAVIALIAVGLAIWRWFKAPKLLLLLFLAGVTFYCSSHERGSESPRERHQDRPWRISMLLIPIAFLAVILAVAGWITFTDETKQGVMVVGLVITVFVVLPYVVVYGFLSLHDKQQNRRSPPVMDDDRRDDDRL